MNNLAANAPPDLGTTVELIVYTTQRRRRDNDTPDENARWYYHCPVDFGMERDMNGVLSPVCYYGGNDISNMIIQTQNRTITSIIKPQGDTEDIDNDFIFSVDFEGSTSDNELCFKGTLSDREGDWDWKGRFAGKRKQSRGRPIEETHGPDGRSTLQELLSYSSMSVQGTNPAQQEAANILGRLIQASIPEDVRQTLQLKIPRLDPEEEDIRQFAPDFLPRAATTALFKQWHGSEYISQKQRDRIDIDKCERFYPACAANSVPQSGNDPVEEFGWDRKRDADIIRQVQGQYRNVSLACYRLGYRRKVTRFHPFLDHPDYWYKRLAQYLVSPTHCERFMLRVLVRDPQVEPDIHDWYTQLALLKEAAEVAGKNIDDAPQIEEVTNTLQGVALLSSINGVQLDDAFIDHLNELFAEIDNLRRDSEEYVRLNKLLASRQASAWSGVRRAVMQSVQHYRTSCYRIPTVGEATKALFRDVGSARCLGQPMGVVASVLVGAAMAVMLSTLALDDKKLTVSEKVTMWLSLAPVGLSIVASVWGLAKRIGAYMTEFLPSRAVRFISAATMTATVKAGLAVCSKIGMTVSYAFGVVFAGFCVWAAYDRFQKMRKEGETIDKCAAGCDLMLSVLFSVVTLCRAVALGYGASSSVLLWYGALSGNIVTGALVSSIVFAVVKWYLHKDLVAPFITKYGVMYDLLKGSAR
ncbi:unnamed protein product [Rhizoctonia solani]|uniref:Uncharacterized protein n=1 Tax=Rhizoctonia solani TaxID=456999 RepID=A0A8H3I179_9AGAM|nr:unnamed protein product [Rhizoctonia solani]